MDILDQESPDRPRGPARRFRWSLVEIVAVVGVLLLPSVSVKQIETTIDPVTGSVRWKTIWLFGISSEPQIQESPLETRLNASGIAWSRSWQFLHKTRRNVFGGATSFGCGSAPPIDHLRPILGEVAAALTDEELREFVDVMQSGTDAEQNAAIEAVEQKCGTTLGAATGGNRAMGTTITSTRR